MEEVKTSDEEIALGEVIKKQLEEKAIKDAYENFKERIKQEPYNVAADMLAVLDVPIQFWKEDDKHYKAVAADLLFKHIQMITDYFLIQLELNQPIMKDDKH